MKARVLIISDEVESARVWGFALNQLGLNVVLIGLSDPVLEIWAREAPDLVIIEDFNRSLEDLALCRQLRALTVVPMLFLTTIANEAFQLKAYRAGVDDIMIFPLTPRIFQAKVKAWLRTANSIPAAALDPLEAGEFCLDPNKRELKTEGESVVGLTVLEARLLYLLMSHPQKVFTASQLVDRVWGFFGEGDATVLKNLVYRLRRKIEPDPAQPRYLVTEGKYGYRFQA